MTVLSKEKTIDVAKIIKNEARLQNRIKELEAELIKLNDSIQIANNKYVASLDRIVSLSKVISTQYEQINKLTENDLNIEKRKSNFGLYSYLALGSNLSTFKTLDIGINIISSKVSYMLSIDPIASNNFTYKVGIGLKLF